jgi:pSer/pThr/pTyr-binding forkhead associated (FHA) protein
MTLELGPRLTYLDEHRRPCEIGLSPERPRLTVGRSEQADIALTADHTVSRLHAAIEWVGTHWTVVDDGLSRNGTYLNGIRIAGRRALHTGDLIRIGDSVLTFRDSRRARERSTRHADGVPARSALTEAQRLVLVALCRPFKNNATYANPASNQQISDELFITTETVKTHMRALFAKFDVEDLPQNQKRARLVERAMQSGVVTDRDL